MNVLEEIVFYTIEKAIKSYRQYAQKQITKAGFDITIDQWLVMKCLLEDPTIYQQSLAKKVFKDNASITRILERLIEKKYLKRSDHSSDKRRSQFVITTSGKNCIKAVQKIVLQNRKHALQGIDENEVKYVKLVLEKMIANCLA